MSETKSAHAEFSMNRRTMLKGATAAGLMASAGTSWAADTYTLRATSQSASRAGVQAVIDRFIARFPGSSVNLTVADVDQLQTSTRVALSSGTAGDVLNTWVGNGNPIAINQLAPGGFLEDLSGQPFADRLPKSIDPVVRVDGKLLIMPVSLAFIGGIYNTRIFGELGVSLPKTWDEFLNVCQKAKDKGIIPIAAGNATVWVNQLVTYALVPSIVYADNPDFNADRAAGKVRFATSAWKEALEKYAGLNQRGFFSPNPNGTSYDEQLQMVAAGKALMAVSTSSGFANIFKYAGHRDFAMMPIPGSGDPAKLWVPAAPSNGYSINAKAKNKDAAVAFLNFMSEPSSVAAFSEAGQLATVMASDPVPSIDPLYAQVLPLFNAGKSTIFMDQTWPNARVQQIHNSGIQELLAGRAAPTDILTRMDEAYGV